MTAPDVVVELTAAAETLRERGEAVRARLLAAGFDEYVEEKTREDLALATLIDGMVGKHLELIYTRDHGGLTPYGSGCLNQSVLGLRLLATYTRTVLGSTT